MEIVLSKKRESHKQSKLLCSQCKYVITYESERIDVNGQHQHHFTNPGGYDFQLGCFQSAPGCSEIGQPSNEFTWFPGTDWQICVCATCGEHLGWKYSGNGDFYGLILTRLEKDTSGE